VSTTTAYRPVIGLEVHVQLTTESKMFCACRNAFGASPNSLTCPVCLGYPGALPVVNARAVEMGARVILALGGEVRTHSVFARKNYFYPDLPKGYQISQYERPLGTGGTVSFDFRGERKSISIERIHLEEDAGKLVHSEHNANESLVDFNRCGVPLLEIVTDAEIESPEESRAFLKKLRRILQYLGVCTGDMEKGALRVDANVSLRRAEKTAPGTRTEIKNLNSFSAMKRALASEIKRQKTVLEEGRKIVRQTMLWDEKENRTIPMRDKEASDDYRYFPEPDLPPLVLDDKWIAGITLSLPELPDERMKRLVDRYGLTYYQAEVLTDTKDSADFFEELARQCGDADMAAAWVMGEVIRAVKEGLVAESDLRGIASRLAQLIELQLDDTVSGLTAREVFRDMLATAKGPGEIIREKGLEQISKIDLLMPVLEKVLCEHPDEVTRYRRGNKRVLAFLIGQVMAATGGKANPKVVNGLLRKRLDG